MQASKADLSKGLIPKDAATVGVAGLLLLLIFYTFHCIWVSIRILHPNWAPRG